MGFRPDEDAGMAVGTTVQVGLAGLGKESAQVKMLEDFGGALGAGGGTDLVSWRIHRCARLMGLSRKMVKPA